MYINRDKCQGSKHTQHDFSEIEVCVEKGRARTEEDGETKSEQPI
jgi:hypothetical protein